MTDTNDLVCAESEIEAIIGKLLTEYELTNNPIEVSFRALIPSLKNKDRFTHLIHAYPAKLLMHIPYFFLNNNFFSKKGDTVLDPFCGTGTVLLESLLAGRNALGADSNPLARLIANVKVGKLDVESLRPILAGFSNLKSSTAYSKPDVVNIDYWFNKATQNSLIAIREKIEALGGGLEHDFFLVCFSNLIKKVSYADPRISVPVKLNPKRYKEGSVNYNIVSKRVKDLEAIDVFAKFQTICIDNIARFENLQAHIPKLSVTAKVISKDARILTENLTGEDQLPASTVDLVITSPPYAGAQKYIRSSSLNLGWLNFAGAKDLVVYDKLNIGRENFTKSDTQIRKTGIADCDELIELIAKINVKRAQIVSNYIYEMQIAIRESIRVLKPGGFFILIVGNNKVCNYEFNTQSYLADFMELSGMKLMLKLIDDIKSYGLMTKRNKTADIISREWVLIFKKVL